MWDQQKKKYLQRYIVASTEIAHNYFEQNVSWGDKPV